MRLFKIKRIFQVISNLYFGIFILAIIALSSSLGSIIEQDESISFYEENYSKPIFGIINTNFILNFGLNHVYTTWWFLLFLFLFGISLLSCTITRQFPLLLTSKEYFFRKKKNSFLNLPFSIKIKNIYFLKEISLIKLQKLNFYIYQKNNLIYGYKGLIGRISPILVHFSLILILIGTTVGAFWNFKSQEILPKGELFHIQNTIRVGKFTTIPSINARINDFWVEYENNRIHQFYSNISILDNIGKEIKEQTISVNNPLRYKNIDFYQSDWNIIGIRLEDKKTKKIYEIPVFPLKNNSKSWITWIKEKNQTQSLLFDKLQNTILVYDKEGNFINKKNINDPISNNLIFIDIIPSTGLLIKYDPSIPIIYLGFGFLMITACLSYLPYTQIWIFNDKKYCWIGSSTNRGKIQLEIEFENLIREIEYQLLKTQFRKNKNNIVN
jgi:cytochrome c biogenesis protein